ncbi:MAG TPA: GNAT family N-acetyltransferase [Flavobacteriales bacterium]|jgi:[ribosomal protein S5]-alanine N-acetyltransferase|nr:GNAT family N-acetyltransferase [Flavobacteriales bacterium]
MFLFDAFPTLTTKRLRLIQLLESHIFPMIEIASYKLGSATSEQALETIQKASAQFQEKIAITWGIEFNGEVIGSIGYYRGFENQCGEIGYVMRSNFKRRGYMIEATEAVIEFGFNELELKRIIAVTAIENFPSVKMLVRLGFIPTEEKIEVYSVFELWPTST